MTTTKKVYQPLSREEVIKAIELKNPERVPMVRAKWWGEGLVEQYGSVLKEFDVYPEDVRNLDVAIDEGASWGYYSQGYGSKYKDERWDWTVHQRERSYEHLSGYQTPPINWGINTDLKRTFFLKVKEITGV